MPRTMKASVFVEPGRIQLQERPIPDVGPRDALVRVTTTTICGTDVHILKGEYPVEGLTIGHEPVGVIESSARGHRLSGRPARDRRGDHDRRPVQRLPVGCCSQDGAGTHTAARRWAAGDSATRSTAARPSTCWCPTRWPTWRRSPTA